MLKDELLSEIHDNMGNGNITDAVNLIDEHFIMYDFWELYLRFLEEKYMLRSMVLNYFSQLVIAYHRIKGR